MRQDYRSLAAYHLCCENSFAPFLLLLREPWSKSLKLGVILSPSVDAVDAKFCICNLQSISQAGRRGFESRLPLASGEWLTQSYLRTNQFQLPVVPGGRCTPYSQGDRHRSTNRASRSPGSKSVHGGHPSLQAFRLT